MLHRTHPARSALLALLAVTAIASLGPAHAQRDNERFVDAAKVLELFTIDESSERLLALCRLMVGREWNGTLAMAVRLSRSAPEAHPQMLVPPQTPGGGSREQAPYVSRRLLRHMVERNEPVIASNSYPTPVLGCPIVSRAVWMMPTSAEQTAEMM